MDWTFVDVPDHLAYCSRDVVARGLELGPDYPEAEQELLTSPQALAKWNERKLAERPSGQTVAASISEWREACTNIRRLSATMLDADLVRPCWHPIFVDWVTAKDLLLWSLTHDWSEFTQLRIYMERVEPVSSAAITRSYLGAILRFFPMMLNKDAAYGQSFTAVMAFTDPEVGAWTIQVVEGAASLSYGAAENADLVMTQSAETFEKSLRGIQDSAEAVRSGAVQVSNLENLGTFGRLFPM